MSLLESGEQHYTKAILHTEQEKGGFFTAELWDF